MLQYGADSQRVAQVNARAVPLHLNARVKRLGFEFRSGGLKIGLGVVQHVVGGSGDSSRGPHNSGTHSPRPHGAKVSLGDGSVCTGSTGLSLVSAEGSGEGSLSAAPMLCPELLPRRFESLRGYPPKRPQLSSKFILGGGAVLPVS